MPILVGGTGLYLEALVKGLAELPPIPVASREAAQATESWSPDPPANCDARRLHSVLESISAGVFGEVHCVRGVLKTDESWVSFELAGRDARVSALPPQRVHEPLVIAMGRRFDRVRLQAAFDACEAAT